MTENNYQNIPYMTRLEPKSAAKGASNKNRLQITTIFSFFFSNKLDKMCVLEGLQTAKGRLSLGKLPTDRRSRQAEGRRLHRTTPPAAPWDRTPYHHSQAGPGPGAKLLAPARPHLWGPPPGPDTCGPTLARVVGTLPNPQAPWKKGGGHCNPPPPLKPSAVSLL